MDHNLRIFHGVTVPTRCAIRSTINKNLRLSHFLNLRQNLTMEPHRVALTPKQASPTKWQICRHSDDRFGRAFGRRSRLLIWWSSALELRPLMMSGSAGCPESRRWIRQEHLKSGLDREIGCVIIIAIDCVFLKARRYVCCKNLVFWCYTIM